VPGRLQSLTRSPRLQWRKALEPIPTVIRWYVSHPAAGTLLLGAFLVVKCFVLSKGDIPTALGILHTAGLVNVAIGGVLSALPILAAMMLAVSVWRVVRSWRPPTGSFLGAVLSPDSFGRYLRDGIPPRAAVTAAAAVLCAVLTPWTFVVGAAVIGGLQGGIEIWSKGAGSGPARRRIVPAGLVLVLRLLIGTFTVYAVVVMLYSVWLPHEAVTLKTGPVPRREVGYVLAEDPGGWITILRTGAHRIVLYPDSEVKSQVICQRASNGRWERIANASTLWDLVTNASWLNALQPATLPPCGQGRSGTPPTS
jgi:hypothetical protein